METSTRAHLHAVRTREFSAAQDLLSRVAGAPDSSTTYHLEIPATQREKATGFQSAGETVKAMSHGSFDYR
jgi:hypothetical protein